MGPTYTLCAVQPVRSGTRVTIPYQMPLLDPDLVLAARSWRLCPGRKCAYLRPGIQFTTSMSGSAAGCSRSGISVHRGRPVRA